ncbi:hypothetical protein GGI20_000779 [Coemansia sp. BCRC 34301]|nr:hypothetical protein GGI20_000779 [Coemansia sp. BCRC 34301]
MVVSYVSSSLPTLTVPDADLPSFFFSRLRQAHSANNDPPPSLYIDGDSSSTLSLDAAETMTFQLASGLYYVAGVRQGDVVAVAMPNSTSYLPIVLAVLTLGATCTLANPSYTSRELAHQLSDSNARVVITVESLLPAVSEAIGSGSNVLVFAADTDAFCALLSDRHFSRPTIDPSTTPAFIPYSSGTTGLPKGVVLSHRNVIANILQITSVHRTSTSQGGTSIAVLPMFHSFGLLFLCFVMPLSGITTVLTRKFDMSQFLALCKEHCVTETMLVPPIINALAKLPAKAIKEALSALRFVVVGAAPLSTDSIAALEAHLPECLILQGYGLTEACPAVSLNPPSARCATSVGRILPSIDAKVVDDEGRPLGLSAVGELCFRGPNIMLGYLNNVEATSETIDDDGFLHTGDIGFIDEMQHVFVTDRKKELIKFNGFQVAPAELEGVLLQHPMVCDCAVKGVFDESRQTEVPRAYLVLTTSDDQTAKTVLAWVDAQVAYYKQLRGGYMLVNAIPRNASGKILRRLLD